MRFNSGCRLIVLAVLLAGAAGCQQPQKKTVDYETSPWELRHFPGTVLQTPHYRVYTTVKDPEFHAAVALLAEEQYARFRDMLKTEPSEEMTVYIFSDVNQWIAFTRAKFGPRAESYLRIRNGGYAADDLAAFYYMGRYASLTVMAHELFHLYLNEIARPEPVPAWINEGLACYFEAHEWVGWQPMFIPKKNLFRRENLIDGVKRNELFSLKELLATHAGEISKLPQSKVLTYYAQVWALTHFLKDKNSGPYHVGFQKMVSELGTRDMTVKGRGFLTTVSMEEKVSFGEAIFRQYVTDDVETFEADFYAWLTKFIGMEK